MINNSILILHYCLFLNSIYLCNGCKPLEKRNWYNDQSNADFINEILAELKPILPVYSNVTVPNLAELIEDFQAGKDNEDVYLNFTELCTKYGYPVEQHRVITEDKYCLTMHRIPKKNAPVVFIMHGVLGSSDDWIILGPKNSLAYGLADRGYDVWLGNARGNKHSRCNIDVSPDCEEFWIFSFDEIGRYDTPAMIDYTLEKTGKSNLAYVGHSQGTASFYVMASEKPEYNEKISIMVGISLVVFMEYIRSPLFKLGAENLETLVPLLNSIGIFEWGARDPSLNLFTSSYCGSPETAEIFCQFPQNLVCGFDYPQMNASVLPAIYGHFPAGSAIRQTIHFMQNVNSGKFRNYDHGHILNMEKYNTAQPPDYPLEKVTCKQAIIYSNNDWLTSAPDIYKFLSKVPNVIEFFHVPCLSFQHFDYLFAKDVDILLNKEIYRIVEEYIEK